jgi:gamma-glutamyl:cysteine ligase YbdK (ATP-grasp superfamily)
MGLDVDRDEFDEDDFRRFAARLRDDLAALEALLARPGFGVGPRSLGAELELALVDAAGRPLGVNRAVWADALDPRVALELDRFNLELNTRPVPLAGWPFGGLGAELAAGLGAVAGAAAAHGGRIAAIGILPTLHAGDLRRDAMTELARFRALSAGLRRLRRGAFEVRIDGDDPLAVACDDVTLEGANTSFQVHLRVDPYDFAAAYDAAQLATAPVLAASGNSPTFLGHRLWEETRIALFKQAVDERPDRGEPTRGAARVSFGEGWVREGAFELFAESVLLHPPLLPVLGDEDPLACVRAGGVPRLRELRLHQGTVWRWNRAIYDPAGGGHLRIEMRSLPAGPSLEDMLANAAFLVGATLALAPRTRRLLAGLPFAHAERNFYRAAQHGLAATLLWPADESPSPRRVSAAGLVGELLPAAREALVAAGVAAAEADARLAVIAERVATGRTGARWQRLVLGRLERTRTRDEALAGLLERYLEWSGSGLPVHRWPVPDA